MARCVIVRFFTLATVFLHFAGSTYADPQKDYSELSLDELLKTPTKVAGKTEESRFTSPAVVTVITAAEIAQIGARNLIDILILVPGLDFGTDTQSTVGLGVRGNWAHEGKFLLQVDGVAMNENMYGTVPLENRFPIEQIQKIEIVRGPGSVVYGGNAEFAVINITTKGASELGGFSVHGSYGQTSRDFARRTLGVSYGKKFGETEVVIHSHFGQSKQSDRNYRDSNGATINLARASALDPMGANIYVKRGQLELRSILEKYHTLDQTAYGVNLSKPVATDFETYSLSARYGIPLSDQLKLTPELSYQYQAPWRVTDPVGGEIPGVLYDKSDQRVKIGLLLEHQVSDEVGILYGLEGYEDFSRDNRGTFQNGRQLVDYTDISLFSEAKWKAAFFNLHAGLRYEYHSAFSSSFAPRIALLRSIGDWNFKLLYSRAFHNPTIENINTNAAIRPEKTGVAEIEVSRQLSSTMFVSANLFNIRVDDPIVYNYAGADSYRNFGKTGTYGIEFEAKYKGRLGALGLNYSYYRKDYDDVAYYQAPGDNSLHLAFPGHKATLNAHIPLTNQVSFSPTLIFFSNRVGHTFDGTGLSAQTFPSQLMANIYFSYKDAFTKNLNLSFGVMNLFDTERIYIQPYNGGHAPLPGQSREYLLKVDYKVEL